MNNALSKNNIVTLMACRYCPMCRHVCSSALISCKESDTPRGRAILLYNIYMGDKQYDESTVESIYNCFLCGCCWSFCEGRKEAGYNIPELIKFARRDIVSLGLEPVKVKKMRESILANYNIYGVSKDVSYTSSASEKKAAILYYLGPDVNFKNNEIAESTISVLKKAGVDYTLLKNEPPSGKVLSLLGYQKDAKDAAASLFERIKKINPKIIVTSDPLAFDAFKNDYPLYRLKLEPNIKIKYTSEFLYDIASEGKVKCKKMAKRITLADSEYFGRFNDKFDAPRKLIGLIPGIDFIDMQRNREKMLATGEAAFYFSNDSIDISKQLGEKIYNMANDVNAEIVVTLSAVAKNNIRKAADNKLEVMDISELIKDCFCK